jgi:photosystem II stability/assembly factor-like uncharacterized protein
MGFMKELTKRGFFPLMCALFCIGAAQTIQPKWITQSSLTTARLRGVSAVSSTVAWASGSDGVYLKTTDGGATWRAGTVPGAETLDFRDVEAFDADTAYLLSIGEGEHSRIYKTTDGGEHWRLQFTNGNPKAFFDAMAFWDPDRGVAVSDSVDGRFMIIKTIDGGASWKELPFEKLPPAEPAWSHTEKITCGSRPARRACSAQTTAEKPGMWRRLRSRAANHRQAPSRSPSRTPGMV